MKGGSRATVSTYTALHALGRTRGTYIAAMQDEPVVRPREELRRDMSREEPLDLQRRICTLRYQSYAMRYSEDVCIHRHSRHVVDDGGDHIGSLAPHTGEPDELGYCVGHDRAVLPHQHTCHGSEVLRLTVGIGDTLDVLEDMLGRGGSHNLGCGKCLEECRSDRIDPFVGTLSGEDHCHKELKGSIVLQFGLCRGHRLLEVTYDAVVSVA